VLEKVKITKCTNSIYRQRLMPLLICCLILTALAGTTDSVSAAPGNTFRAEQSTLIADRRDMMPVMRLFNASDGRVVMGKELFIAAFPAKTGFQAFIEDSADRVRLLTTHDGHIGVWHNANPSTVVMMIQGELVLDIDDGNRYSLHPGDVLMAEDHVGQGHKEACVAPSGPKTCVIAAVVLTHPEKLQFKHLEQ